MKSDVKLHTFMNQVRAKLVLDLSEPISFN